MKLLMIFPAVGLALLASSCRTAYPLCPHTMKPCVHTCVPSYAPKACDCRCCAHGAVVTVTEGK